MIDPKTVPHFTLNSGAEIPCIGMGTFGSDRVSPDDVAGAVAGALRAGYRLLDCAACGCGLLATAHGSGLSDLQRRPAYRRLVECGAFRQVILIRQTAAGREYTLLPLPEVSA